MTGAGSGRDLRKAARACDQDQVQVLLGEGAPADEPDEHGHTALFLAAIFGHLPVMHLLLDAGADPNTVDAAGMRVLMAAASFPRPEVVGLLVEAGAEVNALAEDGRTALLDAIWSADSTPEVVEVLLRAGADTRRADRNYGLTPREWAEEAGNEAVLRLLDAHDDRTDRSTNP